MSQPQPQAAFKLNLTPLATRLQLIEAIIDPMVVGLFRWFVPMVVGFVPMVGVPMDKSIG